MDKRIIIKDDKKYLVTVLDREPYLNTDPTRRVKWDNGNYWRDLWQWDFTPAAGYQCKTYDSGGFEAPSYSEPASAGSNLGIYEAWKITKGKGVTVAIVDSGCDRNHPDLKTKIIGGVSYASGWRWYEDYNNHGTAVAGTVASEENGLGVIGIAPESSLYIIQTLYRPAYIPLIVDAAIAATASVMVMSWGFTDDHQLAKQALIKAGEHGIVVVCAAPNQAGELVTDYPASWQLPNVIVVANNAMNDIPYAVSPTSKTLIHLHAPGRLIIVPKNGTSDYVYTSGTSFSAPKVAGVIALIQSAFPQLTPQERIDKLLSSVDRLPQYKDKTITGGRLNVGWALCGPKQITILENGKVAVCFNGPASSSIQVDETTDFKTWNTLPILQADLSGSAKIYPTGSMGFYRAKLVRPQLEWMKLAKYSPKSVSLWNKLFPPKRAPIQLSNP